MQTYTHLATGALVGVVFFPHNNWMQLAVAAGSVAPDVVPAVQFALDRKRGIKPFTRQSNGLSILKEVSHSLPIWICLAWLGISFCPWPAITAIITGFAVGGVSHELVDGLTHTEERFRATDLTMLWPIPWRLSDLIGIWEYRYDFGALRPKPLEAAALIVVTATALLLHLR